MHSQVAASAKSLAVGVQQLGAQHLRHAGSWCYAPAGGQAHLVGWGPSHADKSTQRPLLLQRPACCCYRVPQAGPSIFWPGMLAPMLGVVITVLKFGFSKSLVLTALPVAGTRGRSAGPSCLRCTDPCWGSCPMLCVHIHG